MHLSMPDFGEVVSNSAIRVAGYAPADSVHSRALDVFAEFVREKTSGALEVEILYNVMDRGRPMSALLDMVNSGEVTMCYFSTSYLGMSVPDVDALEIPFLFDTLDAAHAALDGAFGAALSDAIETVHPVSVLGYWDNGFRHVTNRVRPVRAPADCVGLSVRLQPNRVHAALMEAWGMAPVLAELSDGIRMIADGEVDAQENPLANTHAYGVSHQHVTLTAHLYGARALLANRDELTTLDAASADVVQRAVRHAIEYQRNEACRYEAQLRREFEAAGRQVVQLDDDERAVFVAAAAPVVERARSTVGEPLLRLID